MSLIGTMVGGAGVPTVFAGQAQLDQYLLIGDVDTANPLQGLQVDCGGKTFVNVNSAALITALMKWQMEVAGAVVGLLLKFSTGQVKQNTTYRLVNSGATTPNVFVWSEAGVGVPLEVSTKTINANSYENFDKFSALFLETPANIGDVEITFKDGSKSTLTIGEVDAWFALYNQSEANGRLGTVSVLDNTQQLISSVRVNTNGVGACTVMMVKMPDAAFQTLKARA